MKVFSHILLFCLFTGSILFPVNIFSQLKQYQFEEIEKMERYQPRNIVLFLHTDWCKYCHAMKHTTLKDKELVRTLNEHFYFVMLDPEKDNDILFLGKKYSLKKTGMNTGYHEILTLFDAQKALAYPSIIIIDSFYKTIFKENSFLKAEELKKILEQYNNVNSAISY